MHDAVADVYASASMPRLENFVSDFADVEMKPTLFSVPAALGAGIGWTFRYAPTAPRYPSCLKNLADISP